jgi:hypothetical protein
VLSIAAQTKPFTIKVRILFALRSQTLDASALEPVRALT